MASRSQQIKGLSLVISGDTTPLQTALKGVNGEIRNTKDQLKDVEKLLKLDPGNTELLTQKHKLLGEAVAETKEKLKTLKTANEEAAQSAAKYDAWKEKYDPIRSEIDSTSEKLKKLRTDAADADQQLSEGKISQEKYDAIQGEIRETEDRLKELKASAKDVDEEFGNPVSPEQYDALQREIIETTEELKKLEEQARQSDTAVQKIAAAGEKMKDVGGSIKDVGSTLTKNVTVPVAAAFAGATKSAIDFETALTGVKKTNDELVDSNGNVIISYDDIAEAIKQMSTETASSKEEIAAVMEAAGQLGVGTEYLVDFTKAMIMIGDSTNLSANDAATAIAKMANVTGMSLADVDKFGASLVALGNNFATDEQAIMEMATRLSGAGAQIGLSNGEILGLATALSSVGIQAEMGGSAFSKAMIKMQVATETGYEDVMKLEQATGKSRRELELMASNNTKGFAELANSLGMTKTEMNNIIKAGKNLEDFADVAGMSVDEFVEQFRTDAPTAIQAFISGLGDVEGKGESTIQMLQEMGFTEVRLRDTLTRLANSGDLVTNAVKMGNEAWDDNTALTEEAGKRYSTTESQLLQLKEAVSNLAIDIGEILLPTVLDIVNKAKEVLEWLNNLDPATKEMVVRIALIAAVVGPLLVVIGSVISSVGSIMEFVPKLVSGVQNVIGIGGKLMGGLQSLWGVIIANPIVLIVAAIAAAVAAFIYFWNTSEEFREFWINLWETIKSVASAVVDAVVSFFTETIPEAFNSFVSFLKGLWEGVASFFSGLWEGIKETVSSAWEGIKETLSAIWEAISSIASDLWNGVKDFFGGIWEGIREAASTAWDGIKEMLSTVWEGLKDTASTIWNGVRDFFGKLWDGIGDKTSTAWDGIKDKLLTVWDHLSDKASTVWGGIKTTCTNITDAARREISDRWAALKDEFEAHGVSIEAIAEAVWDAVKDIYSFGFDFIDDLTGGRLSVLKDMFFDVWEDIKDIVSKGVDRLLSFLDFDWQLPHINLPHFSIQGQFSLNPPSVPYLWVDWYKKAMGDGIILNSPTIFGAAGGRLLGGGEAGPEAVVGVDSLRGMIEKAVDGAAANTRPMYMTTILEVDKMEFGRAVYKVNGDEIQRVGAKLVMA